MVLTKEQKLNKTLADITAKTDSELHRKHISKKAVADIAGITSQAVSNQFSRGQLTLSVYLAAQMLIEEQ
jgi:predicted transcriptional regulator